MKSAGDVISTATIVEIKTPLPYRMQDGMAKTSLVGMMTVLI